MPNFDLLIASAPDFDLSFKPGVITVSRGQKIRVTANVSRTVGLSGNITITPPENPGIKIKPPSAVASGNNADFTIKIKAGAAPGIRQLVFTGRTESGRTKTAILRLAIQ